MTDPYTSLEREHEFLNVREVAALLRLSPTSVYRLVERRAIPFHRLPRGLRFGKKDVEAYLQGCRVESIQAKHYERKENPNNLVG